MGKRRCDLDVTQIEHSATMLDSLDVIQLQNGICSTPNCLRRLDKGR
jgi:hypothetical protein